MRLAELARAGRRLAGAAGQAGRVALDVLLPPTCLTCDVPVEAPGQLCAECFRATAFITEPFCRRCGVPFVHAGQAGPARLCQTCLIHPPAFAAARAALRYDAQAKHMLLPFKHADRTETARTLARMMAGVGADLLRGADVLVPVPLHRQRLTARRYNQAALLALALARLAARPVLPDALRRVRPTATLGERGAAERIALLEGVIAVRPARAPRVAGRTVLLIDDVMTSGATANACARALAEAGARRVDVLVAARVPDPRLD
ncbi:MAG: ComF family protein [Alphaproteobacteria bacterium]|nr:ComF family protein [Alphaproteobacteria bacterium]